MKMSQRKRSCDESPRVQRKHSLPSVSVPEPKPPGFRRRIGIDGLLVLTILVVLTLILTTEFMFPACDGVQARRDSSFSIAPPASRPQQQLQKNKVQRDTLPVPKNPPSSSSSFPVIDIISIGSNTRPSYQVAQEQTFARHRSVRQFHRMTEANDTDQECLLHKGKELPELVFEICHRRSTYRKEALMKRHFAPRLWLLEKHENPTGWLCAQKRPLDALHAVILQPEKYELPDYLIIIDDDTWLHMDRVIEELEAKHPSTEHHVVAGCLIRSPKDENFCFQWGGFGLIWSKATLERLLTPLICDNGDVAVSDRHETSDFRNDQEFVQNSCQRLEMNLVGEQHFFKPGMSLLELIYQYGAQQPYTNASQWLESATFCMHSDTTLAYFLQYYHVGQHARDANYPPNYSNNPLERMTGFHGSTKIKVSNETVKPPVYESFGECLHLSDATCPSDSYICHYVTPNLMNDRFYEAVKGKEGNFRQVTLENK